MTSLNMSMRKIYKPCIRKIGMKAKEEFFRHEEDLDKNLDELRSAASFIFLKQEEFVQGDMVSRHFPDKARDDFQGKVSVCKGTLHQLRTRIKSLPKSRHQHWINRIESLQETQHAIP